MLAAHLKEHSAAHVARTVLMVTLGLYSQYWLLIHVSGFLSPLSALLCMLVCRAMFSVPYIHVNIFQVRNTCSRPDVQVQKDALRVVSGRYHRLKEIKEN